MREKILSRTLQENHLSNANAGPETTVCTTREHRTPTATLLHAAHAHMSLKKSEVILIAAWPCFRGFTFLRDAGATSS